MPAALAIPLIAGAATAGTSLAAAKMQSNAAKNAASTQQQSANQALALNERVYNDQKAALAPYQTMGAQSLAALQARYGNSDPAAAAARANAFVNTAQQRNPMQGFGMPGGPMPPQGPPMPPQPPMGGAPQGPPPMSLAALQGGGPMAQPLDGHTLMVGPDGSYAHVPHGNVQIARSRGAHPFPMAY